MSLQKKVLLGAAVGLLLTLGLTLFLLLGPGGDPSGNSDLPDGTPEFTGLDNPGEDPTSPEARPSAEELATEEGEEEEEPAEERPDREPLLRGRVLGETGGLAGARVIVFSTREVERLIRSFERFDPGSGIPDIGKLVKEIKAELLRFKEQGKMAVTDEEGVYAFYEIEPSPHFVLALARDHVFRYGDVVSVERGRTAELDLVLSRGGSISGLVVDPAGQPMPGVTVTAEYRPPGMASIGKLVQKALRYINGEFLKGPFQAVSDAEGRFEVHSLPHGVYDLQAEVAGYPEVRVFGITTGTSEAVVQLQPGVTLVGHLVDESGLPRSGVPLTLSPQLDAVNLPIPIPGVNDMIKQAARFLEDPDIPGLSGEEGQFVFANLGPGPYLLEIQHSGLLPVSRRVTIEAGIGLDLGAIPVSSGVSIRGLVVDPEGAPVPGAEVQAYPEGITFATMGKAMRDLTSGRVRVATDEEGVFEIAGLREGEYRVMAQARGFGGEAEKAVAAGGEPLEIVLQPGVTLEGRVVEDSSGEPLADVRVRASGSSTMTDSEGKFVLEGVAPRNRGMMQPFGNMRGGRDRRRSAEEAPEEERRPDPEVGVRAHLEGYLDERVSARLDEPDETVEIRLRKKPLLHGLALDPDGEPLTSGLARLVPPGLERIPVLPRGAVFLAASVIRLDGTFVLEMPVDGGRFEVMVTHPLYATTSSEEFDPADHDEENPVEVRMSRGARIRGVVSDGDSFIPGARVRLARAQKRSAQEAFFMSMLGISGGGDEVFTSSEGDFDFGQVLPGDYTLTAQLAGFADTHVESFSVVEGDEKSVEISLNPGGPIQGIVLDQDQQPLPGARVRVLKNEGLSREMLQAQRFLGGAFKMATSDAEGRFVVKGLPEDEYTLVIEKKGYSRAQAEGISPDPEGEIEVFLLESARIRGQVVDAATGAPIEQFGLRVEPLDEEAPSPEEAMFGRGNLRPVNDPEGRFYRDNLVEGRYRIEVRADSYAAASTELRLRSGTETELPFALLRAGRLTGVVVDAQTGAPVADARLTLGPPGSATPEEETAEVIQERENELLASPSTVVNEYFQRRMNQDDERSDDAGRFEIDQFDGMPHSVVVTHDDYITEHRPQVNVGLGDLQETTFILRRGLEISGTITDADGTGAERAFVVVRGLDSNTKNVQKSARTGSSGNYEVRGLAPGRYIVVAQKRGGQPVARALDLQGGNVTELGLNLTTTP